MSQPYQSNGFDSPVGNTPNDAAGSSASADAFLASAAGQPNADDDRRILHAIIIGDGQRREFRRLRQLVRSSARQCLEFSEISAALPAINSQSPPRIVVVLQSWSDQFPPDEVDSLIGSTLNTRLLCCFSPYCESDGRNREIWPDALRVPLRLAESILNSEITAIGQNADALPVTSARDEVFAHWLRLSDPSAKPQRQSVLVISPDVSYRRVVTECLKRAGYSISHRPLLTVSRGASAELAVAPDIIVHDLDPWCPQVQVSLEEAQRRWPKSSFHGIATMPDGGHSVEIAEFHESLQSVIPKLDLHHGLLWHLQKYRHATP